MSQTKIADESYINIQGWMINKLKLKGSELLIYAIIYGFSQDGQSKFSGSLQYLADWTNSTKQNCINHLKSLLAKNLIEKEDFEINNTKYCKYSARLDTIQNFGIGIQNFGIDIQNFGINNIDNNIDNTNNINIISIGEKETSKKELTEKQKQAIERNKILNEFIKDEDIDIQNALKQYVEIRKKKGLEPKQLQILLEDFENAYKNKPKSVILEQIRKATAGGWMQLVYNTFSGKSKTSYSSNHTFDNTANHNLGNGKISDDEIDTWPFEKKRNYIMDMAYADMTTKQKDFFTKYCLAMDENGNLLKF